MIEGLKQPSSQGRPLKFTELGKSVTEEAMMTHEMDLRVKNTCGKKREH